MSDDQPGAGAIKVAFFDVDETLVRVKTMLSFLDHYFLATGRSPQDVRDARAMLVDVAAQSGRAASNQAYYRLFAGEDVAAVEREGRLWFAKLRDAGGLFHQQVLDEFRDHQAAGHLTVLVSGSFSACLTPIARHIGADAVLGSEPAQVGDRYSGDVRRVCIGSGKATAARTWLETSDFVISETYGYGDHASDFDLLDMTDHPVVVGSDPKLLDLLSERETKRRLPGIDEAGA